MKSVGNKHLLQKMPRVLHICLQIQLPREVLLEEHLLVNVRTGQTQAPLVQQPGHGTEDSLGLGARGRSAEVLPGTKILSIAEEFKSHLASRPRLG